MPLPREAAASIRGITVPARMVTGQAASVKAVVQGTQLAGRTSSIALELRGATVATVHHKWASDDQLFEAQLPWATAAPGVHRVRVRVSTDGGEPAVADAAVVVGDEPLRVLTYEPRPSWPMTFVRRSLESDRMFSLASVARSSRPAVTTSGDAPRSLASLDADRFDALLVGALEGLTDLDIRALDRFVSQRGGTLLMLPDRQIPDLVRRALGLPQFEEQLLEKPLRIEGGISIDASELLLMRGADAGVETIASIRQGSSARPAIVAVARGAGTIVISGALDAWRYRAQGGGQYDQYWRGLVADGALAAVPKVSVSVAPEIARPGEPVVVRVTVRETEFLNRADGIAIGPVEAALNLPDGSREPIRLWPGTNIGAFEGQAIAPISGRHTIAARAGHASTEMSLLVADDVVHAGRHTGEALRHAARATGGAVLTGVHELAPALSRIEPAAEEETTRPMRSPWWIAPFSMLLCAEWLLRRRSGLK
jgi:hypothetical protein